jgi:serine/threonine protein kinase/tetratricopeptide (TPR) repeat protein
MSEQVISHYELIEQIGRGGMGVVYKARDTRLDRMVALKFLPGEMSADEAARKRFFEEARAISALEHRNICVIHDIDETDDGRLFLAMAYYAGESLYERIRRGPLGVEEALALAVQMAEGLEHAHSKHVLHRDIKPANVILTVRGEPKIVDFGLARLASRPELTRVGTMVGTPAYMSPEQARGEGVDHRSDIWSLGLVVCEMVTGRQVFPAKTQEMALYALFNEDPDLSLLEARSWDLAQIVGRCLEKDPMARWQQVGELAEAIRGLATSIGGGDVSFGDLPTISPADAMPTVAMRRSPLPDVSEIVDPSLIADQTESVFVGREAELERLDGSLREMVDGRGGIVLVSGQVGSGRTALVREFCRRAESAVEDLVVSVGKCSAHTGASDPYSPFRQILSWLSGDFEASGSMLAASRERLERTWKMLPESVMALTESGPGLLDTLVPASGLKSRLSALGEAGERLAGRVGVSVAQRPEGGAGATQAEIFEQFTRVVQALARKVPQIILLEDLHWTDSASASLLAHLAHRVNGHRVLLVATYRHDELSVEGSEERHPLMPVINDLKREFGDIELRLGTEGGREFIDALLETRPNALGPGFRDALYRQTHGLPLFTIELLREMEETKMLVRDDEGLLVEGDDLDWERLPARTEATLADRVERLPDDLLEMLAPASVQGEQFSAEVIARIQEIEPRLAARRLSGELDKRYRLVAARGVRRVDGQRLSEYGFRHILYQRYLYSRLDEVEKSYLHEAVGEALEEIYGERSSEVAVDLARHFQAAGLSGSAIKYHRQAAANAMKMSANLEATEHLWKALALIPELTEAERDALEFGIQTALGPALTAMYGFTAPAVEEAYARARELSQRLQDEVGFPVLWGLFAFYAVRSEFEKSLPLARQMLEAAEASGEATQLVQALYVVGVTHFFLGDLGRAATRLGEALERGSAGATGTTSDMGDALAGAFAQDSRKVAASYEALIIWLGGDEAGALIRAEQALADAREDMHPFTLSTVCLLSGFLHLFRNDPDEVERFATRVVELSQEHQLFQVRDGSVLLACAAVMRVAGEAVEGESPDAETDAMRKALDEYKATGSHVFLPMYLAKLAEVWIGQGRADDALACLGEARETVERSGEQFWKAEIERLQGEALLESSVASDGPDAEGHLQAALETARDQGATALEVRAAISLVKALRGDGRLDEARAVLREAVSRLPEQVSTSDVDEARALLADLS